MRLQVVPVVAVRGRPRRPRHSRKQRDILKDLLYKWGKWLDFSTCKGLSFSSETIEWMLTQYGAFRATGGERIVPNYYPDKRIILIHQQITKLSDEYKDLLMYKYAIGCSYDEIMHYMDKSYKWVRWNLPKAEDLLTIP